MHRHRTLLAQALALVVAAAAGGCESGSSREQGPGPGGPVIGLEPDLRIGVVEGAEELQFGAIGALALDSAGAVYVGDRDNYEVRKFDRNGEFQLRFGGRGEGPGDLGVIRGLAVLNGERVAVVDITNRRVSLFDGSTGHFLDSWPAFPSLVWTDRLIRRRREGGAYLGIRAEVPADGSPVVWPRPVYEARDSDGVLLDTIWAPERYIDGCGTPSSRGVRSGYWEDYRVRYAPKVVWTISSAGDLLIGCPRRMKFDVIKPGGERIRSQEIPYDPVPIAPDEISWFREVVAGSIERTRRMNAAANVSPDNWIAHPDEESLGYEYPETKAAFKSIVVADNGTLWVRLSPPGVEYDLPAGARSPASGNTYWGNGPGATFEVFSGRGEYLGRAELPMDVWSDPDEPVSVPPVITRDYLWAVTLDSLNVQYVTRFRINWAVGTGD